MKNNKQVKNAQPRRHRTAERKGSLELHNGKWRIVALVNGEKIRKSTGTADREEAERIRREYMAQFTARDAVAQAEKLADAVKTAEAKAEAAAIRAAEALPALRMDEALEAYLNDFKRKTEQPTTKSTDHNVAICIGRLCKWIAEHHPECVEMRQFTAAMAEEYFKHLYSDLAATTCGIRLAILRRVWKVLGEQAKCRADPWAKLKAKRSSSRRRENFTPEQVEKIFAKLKPGTELHALCTIGRYTGLRLSDAATLKWSSVDLADNMIELIPMKVQKYGKPVRIPIHPALRSVLTMQPKDGEYVLPKSADLYLRDPTNLTKKMNTLLHAVGLDTNEKVDGYKHRVAKYGFHSFRHSFVSTCGELGIPQSVVQELVGHFSPEMTQHYFHLRDDTARKAIAMFPGAGDPATETAKVETSKVDAAVKALAGLSKEELRTVLDKLKDIVA